MSILVNKDTKVLVQGITGTEGQFHSEQMIKYGTNIVSGVTPKKGGTTTLGNIPVYDTIKEAKQETDANASIIFVPPRFAAGAIIEATKAEMKKVLSEIQDGTFTKEWMAEHKSGQIKFKQMRDQGAKHQIEEVGAKLRSMMPWIASNKLVKDI